MLEGFIGLGAQLFAVTEEQHALAPAGAQQKLCNGDGDSGFAGTRGLDDQGFAALVLKAFGDGFYRFNLIGAIGDRRVGVKPLQFRFAVVTLVNQVIEAVFAVKAINNAASIVMDIIPDKGFIPIGVKHHGPLEAHFLQ